MSGPHVALDEDLQAARFERYLDPDPLTPNEFDRAYAEGFGDAWRALEPKRLNRLGLVAIVAAAAALLIAGVAIGRASAASRPAQTTTPQPSASELGDRQASVVLSPTAADATRVMAGTSAGPTSTPFVTEPPAVAGGLASWFDDGPGLYAAVPSWHFGDRPYRVRVIAGGRSVVVTIRDFCGCPGGRMIDLSPDAFRELAPLSRGVVPVTAEDLAGPGATPPPTDVGP